MLPTRSFRIVALPGERFAPLFDLGEAELAAMRARRVLVDERPGFPCRVSLADAEVGETVMLLDFPHHDVRSAYRASGPIFVREGAQTAEPAIGEVPEMFRHRLLSMRAYTGDTMMIDAAVARGADLEDAIERLFSNEAVAYLHVHNAAPGCYNCRVVRA